MKRWMRSLCTLLLAGGLIAAFFTMPIVYTRAADARLLQAVHTRAATTQINALSPQAEKVPLATMLYAQAHLFNANEIAFAESVALPPENLALPLQELQVLIDSGVLPPSYLTQITGWSRAVNGLLYGYYPENSSMLSIEPVTGKIVSIGWQTDETTDNAQQLEQYIAYLGLAQAQFEPVQSIAQGIEVVAAYAPQLQLYVSVSSDARTSPSYHSVQLTSLSPQQVADITKSSSVPQ